MARGEKQFTSRSTAPSATGRWYDEATANSTSFSRLAARRRMALEMSVPAMVTDRPARTRARYTPLV